MSKMVRIPADYSFTVCEKDIDKIVFMSLSFMVFVMSNFGACWLTIIGLHP